MRILVVDDERVARQRLKRMLERLAGVTVAGEAADGDEALQRVSELAPDLVLLDIRMPGIDGLELARRLPASTHVVFTTAHDEYAVEAFETSAVDYLLKPVRAERLAAAIDRVRRLAAPASREEMDALLRRLAGREQPPRVTARKGDEIRVFDAREIPRFHSRDRYTVFRLGGRRYLLDEPIVALEKRLGPFGFLRVHRSELVNLHHVRVLRRAEGATVVELSDGQRAAVSRRHLAALKQRLGIHQP